MEAIQVVDDIAGVKTSETPKLFYDDSQDSPDACRYKEVVEDAGKSK